MSRTRSPQAGADVLLAASALGILSALAAPVKHGPQRGQAVGCLTILLFALLGLGAVLAAGVYRDVPLLVRVPFWVAVYPVTNATLPWAARRAGTGSA
jgi:hypothetical protein